MLNETAPSRFWAKVDYAGPENCWEWRASRNRQGYGLFKAGGKTQRAHRIMYELMVGPIPNGLCVLHTCDNPPCVNLAHLWLGTRADNNHDRDAKGRQVALKGEHVNGARLTKEKVLAIRSDHRSCRTIGADYGVSYATIGYIKRRETWAHI